MNHFIKRSSLVLLLVLGATLGLSAQAFNGTVSGNLTWTNASETHFLEDIRMQLIVPGHGVVDEAFTDPGGAFSFSLGGFTDGSTSLVGKVRVWAENLGSSIIGRNKTNSGTIKTIILDGGQITLTPGFNSVALGNVTTPTTSRAQCVHWANKAKKFVETEMGTTFAFPTGNSNKLFIMYPPFHGPPVNNTSNLFIPKGAQSNAALFSMLSPIVGFTPILGPFFVATFTTLGPAVIQANFSNKFTLHINNDVSNGALYHEFGHYLMWTLQGEAWLNLSDAGLAYHGDEANDPTQKMAWTEGFSDGFSMIMSSLDRLATSQDIRDLDTTSLPQQDLQTIVDANGSTLQDFQTLNHGFASELHIGEFIYDLWDGPSNLSLLGNSTPLNPLFNDFGEDQTELTLLQILTPMLTKSANLPANTTVLNRFGQDASLINNVVEYHDMFFPAHNCKDHNINHLTRWNNLHNLSNTITDPVAEDEFINSDAIYFERTVATRRFEHSNASGVDYDEIAPIYEDDYKLDVVALQDANDNYNVIGLNPAEFPSIIQDDILVSTDPLNGATLHFNRNLPERFQSANNTWSDAAGVAFSAQGSALSFEACSNSTIAVGDSGTAELGDSLADNTATLTIRSGSSFILGGAPGSSRGPGRLVINNGSRLIIEEGATFMFNPGSEIYLNGQNAVLEINGEWIISENAIFSFTGSGYLETGLPDNAVVGNVSMGTHSGIQIDGKGKQEHIIWKTKPNTNVVLPPNHNLGTFFLSNGIVELGKTSGMHIRDHLLQLNSLIVRPLDNLTGLHNGIHCLGHVSSLSDNDFIYGLNGLLLDMTGNFANSSINVVNSKFLNCGIGLQQIRGQIGMIGGFCLDNDIGWHGAGVLGNNAFFGLHCSNNSKSIVLNANPGSGPVSLEGTFSSISNGDYAIDLTGPITLTATCLNIDTHITAVTLSSNATVDMASGQSSQCSFSSSSQTFQLNDALFLDLSGGGNEFISGTGIIFNGSMLPRSISALDWNGNNWQGISSQPLLPSNMNLVNGNTQNPIVPSGTGMTGFSLCEQAQKTSAASSMEEELTESFQVQAFPQPFSDALHLRISGLAQQTQAQLSLYDIRGTQVMDLKTNLENGDLELSKLTYLPNGIYFLKIQTKGQLETLKLIKQ